MRVCIIKATGRLLEAQSGDGDLSALVTNAQAAGFQSDQVDVRRVSNEEFKTIMDAEVAAQPPRDPLDSWDRVSLQIAFNHENRIRVLESKAPVTLAQFKNAVKALLA